MTGLGDPSTVKHPYMIGEPTAIAAWDAARAAGSMLKRVKSGITPDNRVVWTFADHQTMRTIASVQLLDVPGDATRGQIWH